MTEATTIKTSELLTLSHNNELWTLKCMLKNNMVRVESPFHDGATNIHRKHVTPVNNLMIHMADGRKLYLSQVFDRLKNYEDDKDINFETLDKNHIWPCAFTTCDNLNEYVVSVFTVALPGYDPDEFLTSDMIKVLKWYKFLKKVMLKKEVVIDYPEVPNA